MPSSRTRSSVCSSVLPPRDASNPPPRGRTRRPPIRERALGRSPPNARARNRDGSRVHSARARRRPRRGGALWRPVRNISVGRSKGARVGRSVDRSIDRSRHDARDAARPPHASSSPIHSSIDRPVITPTREVSHRSWVDVHANRSCVVHRSTRGGFDRKEMVSIERRWYR